MQLTGTQVARIIDALLTAYSKDSLRELVRVELDATLESIAGGDNLRVVFSNLVSWAEQQQRGRHGAPVGRADRGAVAHAGGPHRRCPLGCFQP